MMWQRPPDFASTPVESPVHNERCTPGSARGTRRLTALRRQVSVCPLSKSLVEAKRPYLIKRHDGAPFAFAGIWDKVQVKGEMVDACAILTTTPRGVMPEVQDRMPVILPPDAQAKWLDPSSRYRDLLEPDADTLELVEVSTLVNSVKNEDPNCAVEIAAPNSA